MRILQSGGNHPEEWLGHREVPIWSKIGWKAADVLQLIDAIAPWVHIGSPMDYPDYYPFRSEKAKAEYIAWYQKLAKRWPIPSEERMVDTPYGQTYARVSGLQEAPPLVLLPGASANTMMWLPNIEIWSRDFQTFAIDNIIDFGRSIRRKPIRRPEELVDWLDSLFTALKLGDRIYLLGMSYGGWMAGQYLVSHPERLVKVVMLAPASTVISLSWVFILRMTLAALPSEALGKNFNYWLFADIVAKEGLTTKLLEMAEGLQMARQNLKPSQLIPPTVLSDDELGSIQVPTLYLVGENEKIYRPDKAIQRLKAVAPQVKSEIIPGAGHDLTFVQADLVNKKVLEFLKRA